MDELILSAVRVWVTERQLHQTHRHLKMQCDKASSAHWGKLAQG